MKIIKDTIIFIIIILITFIIFTKNQECLAFYEETKELVLKIRPIAKNTDTLQGVYQVGLDVIECLKANLPEETRNRFEVGIKEKVLKLEDELKEIGHTPVTRIRVVWEKLRKKLEELRVWEHAANLLSKWQTAKPEYPASSPWEKLEFLRRIVAGDRPDNQLVCEILHKEGEKRWIIKNLIWTEEETKKEAAEIRKDNKIQIIKDIREINCLIIQIHDKIDDQFRTPPPFTVEALAKYFYKEILFAMEEAKQGKIIEVEIRPPSPQGEPCPKCRVVTITEVIAVKTSEQVWDIDIISFWRKKDCGEIERISLKWYLDFFHGAQERAQGKFMGIQKNKFFIVNDKLFRSWSLTWEDTRGWDKHGNYRQAAANHRRKILRFYNDRDWGRGPNGYISSDVD